jgi:hypothetical protein
VLAVQADGCTITTVEGLAGGNGDLHTVQRAFHEQHALQCGYCTPGMIMSAVDLLAENPNPSEDEIREGLSGNLCRCTGYQNIVKAVQAAASAARPHRRRWRHDRDHGQAGSAAPAARGRPPHRRAARWTENITLPGMVHMAILRSPYAHARIVSVNTAPARAKPNVIDAFSGSDVKDTQGVMACAWPVTEDMVAPTYLPLAIDEVRHVGEPVAVVVARDRASAVDALEAIEVEYETLPVVLDLEAALAPGSALVHADKGTNKCYTWVLDSAAAGSGGDVAQAEAEAEVVIKRRYVQQRLIPSFMEPRSHIVDPSGGEWTLYSSTQIPHITRFLLAATTGTPEHKIRVIAPDVGGGFGAARHRAGGVDTAREPGRLR